MSASPKSTLSAKLMLLSAMVIWPTLGLVRHHVPLDSAFLVAVRSVIGALCMLGALLLLRRRPDWAGIRANAWLLAASGVAVGINWLLLFEAFSTTTVAVATICYYMAPILVMLASPLCLGESINARKAVGILCAFLGIACVSGLFQRGAVAGVTIEGVLFGLGAAVFYATLVLLNKRMRPMDPIEQTGVQLFFAAAVLVPYVLSRPLPDIALFTPTTVGLTLMLGFVHTGLACFLYFGSMQRLPAQTVALLSYLDPILAVLFSVFLLGEPMTTMTVVGTVLVLGGALLGERFTLKSK